MPITLNNSNISIQYNTGSNYIIDTVKSDIYVINQREQIVNNIITNNIQTASVTPTTYVDNSGNVYAVESYTYSGTANTKDYTRVFPKNTTCDILIVGGGGGGGASIGSGGGGGGLLYYTGLTITANTYTISVGNGGTGATNYLARGANGSNSSAVGYTAYGGGGGSGQSWVYNQSNTAGGTLQTTSANQGSGGGGTRYKTLGNAGTSGQGNSGGNSSSDQMVAGGGGGAGGVGGTAQNTIGGLGGAGTYNSITGSSIGYAGGGAGSGGNEVKYGALATEGGGNSGPINGSGGFLIGGAGTNGRGGGGGGGVDSGGAGGSGIVIIRYLLGNVNYLTPEPSIILPTFTESIRTFIHSGGAEAQTSYNITVGQNTICDILIVGGGGGGADFCGGGGAGAVLYTTSFNIFSGSYTIKVGKGGAGGSTDANAPNGINSSITISGITYEATGGGGGGQRVGSGSYTGRKGSDGGSGGGGATSNDVTVQNVGGLSVKNTYTGWTSLGNSGGEGKDTNTTGYGGGGGGGAGGSGGNAGANSGGNGGVGIDLSSIFGTSVGVNGWFGGGGGGGSWISVSGTGGSGGTGGGGSAYCGNGVAGTGGGGGGGGNNSGVGGSGGSGIVIIKFKSTTTISEGNPITHKRLNFTYSPNYPIIQADSTNLKAWYKFDGNYNDSSPSGFNLTNSGAAIVDGLIVQSVSTDSNDFLQTSGINLNGKTYSISFWLKLNTTLTTTNNYFFSQGATESPGLALHFLYESANNLRFSHWGGGNDIDTTGYNMINIIGTSWHHYVVTYNNTNRAGEIWFDGVKLNTNISTFANTFSGSGNFIIARSSIYGGTFNGLMEDFRYYDKVLISTEITQLYNIPTTNQYTLNFPVPTVADINNNSNIVLRGAYDISLSTTSSLIIPKAGQYIPRPTTFATSNMSIRYNLLNPTLDPIGAQWTYNSSNTSVYHMGSVGIGTTNPEYQLDVRGNIYSSTGGFTQSGLTTWTVLSDRRIKENVVKASYEKCLENVKNIELYNFNFKENYVSTNDRHQLGFIAQEVQEVYPKAVEVGKIILNLEEKIDDLLTLNTTQIDYTLYGAVKGLIQKMENIKIKIEQIKGTSNITT